MAGASARHTAMPRLLPDEAGRYFSAAGDFRALAEEGFFAADVFALDVPLLFEAALAPDARRRRGAGFSSPPIGR